MLNEEQKQNKWVSDCAKNYPRYAKLQWRCGDTQDYEQSEEQVPNSCGTNN